MKVYKKMQQQPGYKIQTDRKGTNPGDYSDMKLHTYDWKWTDMFQHTLQVASACLNAAQISLALHVCVNWFSEEGSRWCSSKLG